MCRAPRASSESAALVTEDRAGQAGRADLLHGGIGHQRMGRVVSRARTSSRMPWQKPQSKRQNSATVPSSGKLDTRSTGSPVSERRLTSGAASPAPRGRARSGGGGRGRSPRCCRARCRGWSRQPPDRVGPVHGRAGDPSVDLDEDGGRRAQQAELFGEGAVRLEQDAQRIDVGELGAVVLDGAVAEHQHVGTVVVALPGSQVRQQVGAVGARRADEDDHIRAAIGQGLLERDLLAVEVGKSEGGSVGRSARPVARSSASIRRRAAP